MKVCHLLYEFWPAGPASASPLLSSSCRLSLTAHAAGVRNRAPPAYCRLNIENKTHKYSISAPVGNGRRWVSGAYG